VEHPKVVGDRSTLAIMWVLRASGYDLLVPFGENTGYDLVIDDGERLAKCSARQRGSETEQSHFATCSSYAHHPNPKRRFRSYAGEVDYFPVYCAATAGVYLIPTATFRLDGKHTCASSHRETASGRTCA
jgi:PD-(D/E)XK endonuclease